MSRRESINAILFSIVMVLSMVAFATAGVGMAFADEPSVEDEVQLSQTTSHWDSVIGPSLERMDGGTAEVYIHLEYTDIPDGLTERDAIADYLKSHSSASQAEVVPQLESSGVEIINTYWIANIVRAELDVSVLDEVAQIEGVQRINEVPEYRLTNLPADPVTLDDEDAVVANVDNEEGTWAWEQINVSAAWDQGFKGEGVNITILDTGVDPNHEDIDLYTEDETDPSYPGGWAEVLSDGSIVYTDAHDSQGHGTSTSGVAGAQPTAEGAAIDNFGVAPEANLKHVKVFDFIYPTDTLAGFEYAVDPDGTIQTDITSKSFGACCNFWSMDWVQPIYNAQQMGIATVTSSGNSGEGLGQVGDPANIFENLAVGATDINHDVTSFSSGSFEEPENWSNPPERWPDDWVKPEVSAPGADVPTAAMGGGYREASGTSFSAPAVAGVVALQMSKMGPDNIDSFEDIKDIEQAQIDTAWKPPDWDPEDDAMWYDEETGLDSRYGAGIVHAGDAVSETPSALPEYGLGDVMETGEVTIDDAVKVQEYLAGTLDPEATFNENLADMDRDGDITIDDAVKVQEKLAGLLAPGEIEISNFDAPTGVPGGEAVEVSATLTNVGDEGALELIEAHIADELNEPLSSAEMAVDMAIEGVEDPVDLPHQANVTLTLGTDGIPGGDYQVGILSDDHAGVANITILQPFFEVTDLEAPEEIDQGELVTVNATVENTGNQNDTQTIEYVFDGQVMDDNEVTLEPGEAANLSFELVTDDIAGGLYEHGVHTDDDQATTELTINQAFFEVSDVDGPAEVSHGDEITVTATVENIGNATDEQVIEYELDSFEVNIGVVDTDLETDDIEEELRARGLSEAEIEAQLDGIELDQMNEFTDFLEDELPDSFNIYEIHPDDLLDHTDFDIYIISQFSGTSADDFFDELDDDQATIHLDQWSSTQADGVLTLHDEFNDPGQFETAFGGSGADLHIEQSHPLFDGIGGPGDVVPYHTAGFGDRAWFDDYSGEVLADISSGGGSADGPAVGVNDAENQILLSSSARVSFTEQADFTEDENQLILNAIDYAFEEHVQSSAVVLTTETIELDPGESEDVSFTYTVSSDDGIGEMDHIVSSEDHVDTAPVTVMSPEHVEITDLVAPDEVLQSHEIDIDVHLEHIGDQTTTQDVHVWFDGENIETVEVTLDPGETDVVTVQHEIPIDQEPGTYTIEAHVDFSSAMTTIDVLEADPANFDVSDFEAPDEAGQGDTYNVTATITNTGDLEGTQTITYEFEDDEEEPFPDEVSVGIINYGDDTWKGTYQTILEDHLDTDTYEFTLIDQDDDLVDAMGDHDVFLVHRLGLNEGGFGDNPELFLDNLEDDQAVVYLSTWGAFGSQYPDGIESLESERDDPASFSTSLSSTPDTYHTILEDHPIFDGVGSAGDTVLIKETGYYGVWDDEDYTGTNLAELTEEEDGSSPEGIGVGVDDDRNEVLLGAFGFGSTFGDTLDHRVDAANITLANAVEYATLQAFDLVGSASISSDAELSETTEFAMNDVDMDDFDPDAYEIQSPELLEDHLSEELTLAAGESATVEFTFTVDVDMTPGEYEHGIHSEDDSDTDTIDIFARSADIGVMGWFPDPDPAEETIFAGDTMTAEIVLFNDGDLIGEFEAKLTVGNQVVNSTVVEVPAGQVKIVELSTTLDEVGSTIMTANWVDPIKFDVEDPDPPDFQVTIDESTDQVMWGEEIEVDATVHNAGEEQDTQTIEFLVDGAVEASEEITLRHDESESFSWTYETVEDDVPEIDVEVASDDDAAVETVTVDAPAEFLIEVIDYDDEVIAGDQTVGELYIENVGTLTDTQTVTMYVDGEEFDDASITLDGGDSDTMSYAYTTDEDDIPEVEFEFTTENDTDSVTTTVLAPPNFEVELTDYDDEVMAGDSVTVDATVENTGEVEDTQTITFLVDGSQKSSQTITLDEGESHDFSFTYVTDEDDAPEIEVAVESDDDAGSAMVTVNTPANFQVTIDDYDDEVEAGEEVDVEAIIENTGTLSGTQTIEFLVDGAVEDSESVQLDGGDDTVVDFTYETDTDDIGTIDVTVQSEDDSDTVTVDVLDPVQVLSPDGEIQVDDLPEGETAASTDLIAGTENLEIDLNRDDLAEFTVVFDLSNLAAAGVDLSAGDTGPFSHPGDWDGSANFDAVAEEATVTFERNGNPAIDEYWMGLMVIDNLDTTGETATEGLTIEYRLRDVLLDDGTDVTNLESPIDSEEFEIYAVEEEISLDVADVDHDESATYEINVIFDQVGSASADGPAERIFIEMPEGQQTGVDEADVTLSGTASGVQETGSWVTAETGGFWITLDSPIDDVDDGDTVGITVEDIDTTEFGEDEFTMTLGLIEDSDDSWSDRYVEAEDDYLVGAGPSSTTQPLAAAAF